MAISYPFSIIPIYQKETLPKTFRNIAFQLNIFLCWLITPARALFVSWLGWPWHSLCCQITTIRVLWDRKLVKWKLSHVPPTWLTDPPTWCRWVGHPPDAIPAFELRSICHSLQGRLWTGCTSDKSYLYLCVCICKFVFMYLYLYMCITLPRRFLCHRMSPRRRRFARREINVTWQVEVVVYCIRHVMCFVVVYMWTSLCGWHFSFCHLL